ncbi:hypothetical protein [Nostoc sp.]
MFVLIIIAAENTPSLKAGVFLTGKEHEFLQEVYCKGLAIAICLLQT